MHHRLSIPVFPDERAGRSRVGGEDHVPLYPGALSWSYLYVRLHLQQGYTVTPSSSITVDLLHRRLSPHDVFFYAEGDFGDRKLHRRVYRRFASTIGRCDFCAMEMIIRRIVLSTQNPIANKRPAVQKVFISPGQRCLSTFRQHSLSLRTKFYSPPLSLVFPRGRTQKANYLLCMWRTRIFLWNKFSFLINYQLAKHATQLRVKLVH